jgi:PPOX class probable F420-dependent enzyme
MDRMSNTPVARFAAMAGGRYLNLETYRRTGAAVRTPVWFAADPGAAEPVFYIYAGAQSGKVKRLRHTSRVQIALCDGRGKVTGNWIDARAELVSGPASEHGMRLLDRKYWPWKQLIGLGAWWSGPPARAVIAIRPAS